MDDFKVPGKSRRQIFRIADVVRKVACPENEAWLDVVRLVEVILPQAYEEFVYHVVPDEELGDAHAKTFPDQRVMVISKSTYDGARRGQGRPRFTLAHEIGHLFMHRGVAMARPTASGEMRVAMVAPAKTYESSEWQAEAFGGGLLMPADHFRTCRSIQEVANLFGVTEAAARSQARAYIKERVITGIAGL